MSTQLTLQQALQRAAQSLQKGELWQAEYLYWQILHRIIATKHYQYVL